MNTILLIEDDPDIRLVLGDLLVDEGYRIKFASNGHEALEVLKNSDPISLILLDWNMPLMNGEEFLREKAKVDQFLEVPVVVVSASVHPSRVAEGIEFLSKPVDVDDLLNLIKRYCGI